MSVMPVRRQTYGYLPSRQASPPIGWYQIILLGDRGIGHMCHNNLPRVGLDSGEARTQPLSTQPPSYTMRPTKLGTARKISQGQQGHSTGN